MESKKNTGQLTGMLGVYLTAAELTQRGFIVSVTSRNAQGADLLVTDPGCKKPWTVQVKTQKQRASYWLVGAHAREIDFPNHVYVFINLRSDNRPDYLVIPSEVVAGNTHEDKAKTGSTFYWFGQKTGKEYLDARGWKDGWEVFDSTS